jgi:hypothetical protein
VQINKKNSIWFDYFRPDSKLANNIKIRFMKKSKSIMHALAILLIAQNCLAGENKLVQEAETVLRNASAYFQSISTLGGYVGIYSIDLKQRYGEAVYEKAKASEIWVQPPGTPSVGECFLRAYRLTGEKQYMAAATDAARALAWGQRTAGGWDHRVDLAHLDAKSDEVVRKEGRCTFDDKISQGALSFLMSMDEVINEPWLSEAIQLGLEFMLKSQFENGAWPQWYPLRGGYHDYYTFNDNSINDCIKVMLKAHRIYEKDEYLQAAIRGGDFIILSQLPLPQPGWAQQYSHDLKPAWARSFEPPGVCSAVTIRNIRTLIDLHMYTRDEKYLEPIPAAFEWLDKSKIGDNLWARLYEEGTNKPVYGDREDGYKVHYVYENISERERTSYGWQGQYGIDVVAAYYNDAILLGAEGYTARIEKAGQMEAEIKSVISRIDDKGRWINNDMITCRDFVMNMNMLCEYLELSKGLQ